MTEWKVVRKDSSDFLEKSHPWKATNGSVCSDHKTEADAQKLCNEENERDCQ